MSKDREYISELFGSDGIKAPESLSEENMLAMLEAADSEQTANQSEAQAVKIEDSRAERKYEKKRAAKKPALRKGLAIAAVAVIALFGVGGLTKVLNAPPDTSVSDGELYTFKSEAEIGNLIDSMNSSSIFDGLRSNDYSEDIQYDIDSGADELLEYDAPLSTGSADNSVAAKGSSGAGSEAHSETYLQVEDVDEADIVKTDGKYIYYVNNDMEVVILSAKDGETEKVSVIGNNGIENYVSDIYLKGDTLVTVGRFYRDGSDEACSGIVVYDISDRSDPKVVSDYSQSGSILSSRMVGDCVYLVTNEYVYKGSRIVPMCGTTGDYKKMDARDICCVPDPRSASYIIVSAIDVSSGSRGKAATKAVFGSGSAIYCSDHSLYATSDEYDSETSTYCTRIVRAQLDGTDVRFDATAKVRGYIDSQFSMDEKDGYFRIATTSDRDGMDVNNLFVLDPSLKEAGKVTGFARNESIKAVRYIGDKAYVITYEAIDPLFVIDLSDPAAPEIEGEVMIDGFSTLLVPVSGDRLLGIGHATGDNGYGGEYDSGLKIVLFDISDPSEPKVLDSREFEDMTSPAQDDHHALTVNTEAGWFAIPYDVWHYSEEEMIIDYDEPEVAEDGYADEDEEYTDRSYNEAGILVFSADDSFTAVDRHELGEESLYRSVYIGDWIYALDEEGNASSFIPEL